MLQFPTPSRVHGRFAPSPTGPLHVGSARTALVAWLSARKAGGSFSIRMEDLDGPRTVPGAADDILRDLEWLGLDWDAGPVTGGPHGPYRQSERHALYEATMERLFARGRLFPCSRSRKDLRQLATAPHGYGGLRPYPASLCPNCLPAEWFNDYRRGTLDAALRFRVAPGRVSFEDLLYGQQSEDVASMVGDYVVQRRDGVFAYQLAVTVDDLMMGITEVVRGKDLLASTARQIQLADALGGWRMMYGHVPLVLNANGDKLSKRDSGLTLAAVRAARVSASELVGRLGESLGLLENGAPSTPLELLKEFDWRRLPSEPWTLRALDVGVQ